MDPSGYGWLRSLLRIVAVALAIVATVVTAGAASPTIAAAIGLTEAAIATAGTIAVTSASLAYASYAASNYVGRGSSPQNGGGATASAFSNLVYNPPDGVNVIAHSGSAIQPGQVILLLGEETTPEQATLQDSWSPLDFIGPGEIVGGAESILYGLGRLGVGGFLRVGAEETGSRGAIVIGENMDRVRRAGKMLGAKVFRGNTEAGNIRFINNAVKEGRPIFDIGPDFARRLKWLREGRTPAGEGYSLERKLTVDYGKVIKLWRRTGKLRGTSRY